LFANVKFVKNRIISSESEGCFASKYFWVEIP
jgi:hypothetical protein